MGSIIALLNKMDWFPGYKRIIGGLLAFSGAGAGAALRLFGMEELAGFADMAAAAGVAIFGAGIMTAAARPV